MVWEVGEFPETKGSDVARINLVTSVAGIFNDRLGSNQVLPVKVVKEARREHFMVRPVVGLENKCPNIAFLSPAEEFNLVRTLRPSRP